MECVPIKNAIIALRTRELDGIQIPWFAMSAVFYGNTAPDIMTWVMEYHEDFLKGIKMSTHHTRNKEVSFSFGNNSLLIIHADNTATWKF